MKKTQYRYVAEFKCLMEQCIDTCCGDWQVNINKDSYQKLHNILADEEFKNKIDISLKLSLQKNPEKYAYIQHLENGKCPFLRDGLCEIHSDYGDEILPSLCKTYPKVDCKYFMNSVLSASLSCPEIVKILSEITNPYEELDIASENIGDNDPYVYTPNVSLHEKMVYQVRGALISILEHTQIKTPSERLFVMCYFAANINPLYEKSTLKESDLKVIKENESAILEKDKFTGILQEFFWVDEDIFEALLFISSVLQLRKSHINDSFTQFVTEIEDDVSRLYLTGNIFSGVEQLMQVYKTALNDLSEKDGDRVDKYVSLYIDNVIRREHLGKMSDLFVFCYMVNIRYSVLKFLLVMMVATKNPISEELFIKAVYQFARAFDHDVEMMTSIYDALNFEGLFNLAYARKFLRV